MNVKKSIFVFMIFILLAFLTSWFSVYQKSKSYYYFAEDQYKQGHYILALKGMNKIELYPEDEYFGGYQEVIASWKNIFSFFYPSFYYQAQERVNGLISKVSSPELSHFIDQYTEIDTNFVPEAATCLLLRYRTNEDSVNENKMSQFLEDAFPTYHLQDPSISENNCQFRK